MKSANAAALSFGETKRPAGDSAEFGKTQAELADWINCIGAPLVVVEKRSLTVRSANRNAAAFFGLALDDFSQAPIALLVGGQATQMLGQIWSNAPTGVPGEPFLLRGLVQDQERLLIVQVTKLVVESETVRLFSFTDAPPHGSVALAGWQQNIIDMLNWLPFGFEIATSDDQIQFANSQFNALFGYSPDDISSIEDWWRLVYPDPDYREYAKHKWKSSIALARQEDREMTPFDLEVTTASGARRTIQFRQRTINNFNVNLYLDVTSERAAANELKSLAETDPLTGAMNRRSFFDAAAKLYLGESAPDSGAVLMIDLDNFKHINDAYGHATGDRVLREFTERCRIPIRTTDLLARLGGEEFAILLTGVDRTIAGLVVARILDEVRSRPFEIDGQTITVTVSIGVALRRESETAIDATLSRADKALYTAKNGGRDAAIFHDG